MKLPKLSTGGSMRGKMLKAKTSPSIKLSSLPSVVGPKRPMTRSLVGKPLSHGEMI